MLPPATIETLVRDHQRHLLDEGDRHRLVKALGAPSFLGAAYLRLQAWPRLLLPVRLPPSPAPRPGSEPSPVAERPAA